MSLAALLQGVRTRLQSASVFNATATTIDIQPDPQPPPFMGEYFISISPGTWGTGDTNEVMHGLDEVYGVLVTVNMKTGKVPRQKIGTNVYILALTGIEAYINKIKAALHLDYTSMAAANALLTTVGTSKFIEPLRFRGCEEPTPRTGEWFWSDDPGDMAEIRGWSATLRFDGARRIQALSNLE